MIGLGDSSSLWSRQLLEASSGLSKKQADSKQWEQGLFLGHWLALENLRLMLDLFVQPEYRGMFLALTQLDRSCFPNAHERPTPFWVNIEKE